MSGHRPNVGTARNSITADSSDRADADSDRAHSRPSRARNPRLRQPGPPSWSWLYLTVVTRCVVAVVLVNYSILDLVELGPLLRVQGHDSDYVSVYVNVNVNVDAHVHGHVHVHVHVHVNAADLGAALRGSCSLHLVAEQADLERAVPQLVRDGGLAAHLARPQRAARQHDDAPAAEALEARGPSCGRACPAPRASAARRRAGW